MIVSYFGYCLVLIWSNYSRFSRIYDSGSGVGGSTVTSENSNVQLSIRVTPKFGGKSLLDLEQAELLAIGRSRTRKHTEKVNDVSMSIRMPTQPPKKKYQVGDYDKWWVGDSDKPPERTERRETNPLYAVMHPPGRGWMHD